MSICCDLSKGNNKRYKWYISTLPNFVLAQRQICPKIYIKLILIPREVMAKEILIFTSRRGKINKFLSSRIENCNNWRSPSRDTNLNEEQMPVSLLRAVRK
jgi:hypothetical protein